MLQIHILLAMLLILVAVVIPVLYFKKTKQISLLVFLLGGVGFYLSSQIFENLLHRLVLQPQADGTIALMKDSPLLYVLYGITAAAIFEETARYLIFYYLQKKRPLTVNDSLAYGLGHGGIEAFFIGIAGLLNLFFLVQLVSQGDSKLLAQLPQVTISYVQQLQIGSIYLLAFERILALAIQVFLTFWVWAAVKERTAKYFFAALVFHALINLAPALVQVGWLAQPILVEVMIFVEFLALVYLTKKFLPVYFSEARVRKA
ncbi:YhfC family intramembrane metalloprotease [Streptococcus sp. Marseille-P7376]|uniref:YhfC family intramembrane metalloprotease n=1 Tax=Streptococcus sp. Marseille-P7376 TaxID=2592044 RepID=UPI0011E7D8FC|nr:YhfC family glutamic-type intramembrane protease [Streptococcus sp. Marseille-P7376]